MISLQEIEKRGILELPPSMTGSGLTGLELVVSLDGGDGGGGFRRHDQGALCSRQARPCPVHGGFECSFVVVARGTQSGYFADRCL